jgi:AraC-like DNA-binding protein
MDAATPPISLVNGITLHALALPYAQFRRANDVEEFAGPGFEPGLILALRIEPDAHFDSLVVLARQLQSRVAHSPVALWTERLAAPEAIALMARLRPIGIRACIHGPTPDAKLLRQQLADPTTLEEDVVRWLGYRAPRLVRAKRPPVIRFVSSSLKSSCFREAVVASAWSVDSLRRHFARSGLGSPRRWYDVLVFALHCTWLQRDDGPIEAVALEHGYYDAAAFRRRCRKLLDVPPSFIRDHLGFEWLLSLACRKRGLLAGGH